MKNKKQSKILIFLFFLIIIFKKNLLHNNRARLIFDRAIGAGRTANYADYRLAQNILLNFDNLDEVIVNLFMKLNASNLTKFDDLGVKLKKIEDII